MALFSLLFRLALIISIASASSSIASATSLTVSDTIHSVITSDISALEQSIESASGAKKVSEVRRLRNFLTRAKTIQATQKSAVFLSGSTGTFYPVEITYYADAFVGRTTAGGARFSQTRLSAAACGVPLGALLEISVGTKRLVVPVNDRPNCAKFPNVVDLSTAAFDFFGSRSAWRLTGSARIVGQAFAYTSVDAIPRDRFADIGIVFDTPLQRLYTVGDTLTLVGKASGASTILAQITTPSGKRQAHLSRVNAAGEFRSLFPLTESGAHSFIIAAGNSFQTSLIAEIIVAPQIITESFARVNGSGALARLPAIERHERPDLSSVGQILLETPTTQGVLAIAQNGQLRIIRGVGTMAFYPQDFSTFVSTSLAQARFLTSSDGGKTYTLNFSWSVSLAPFLSSERIPERSVQVARGGVTRLTGNASWPAQTPFTVYLIDHSGAVQDLGKVVTPASGRLSIPLGTLTTAGVYRAELVGSDGFALHDQGFTVGATLPILPTKYDDISLIPSAKIVPSVLEKDSLIALNAVRATLRTAPLALDATLTAYATEKAQDMADNTYIGHVDSQGRGILGLILARNPQFRWAVGENVAGGTVSYRRLIAGLELSASHRSNMLDAKWKKVGVAGIVRNGRTYYVQVFGQ